MHKGQGQGQGQITTSGPFYLLGLTLIPAWISNHMHYKVWDEITYPFLNFNGATMLKFRNGQVISSHILPGT